MPALRRLRNGSFPAVVPSTWTGLPNDGTPGGTILNAPVLAANIQFAVTETTNRTQAQADAAYFDDRRGKGFSVTDGMGPLTDAWRAAAQQTTTITTIPANATTVLFNDTGNNIGVGSTTNATFGKVVDLLGAMGNNASTRTREALLQICAALSLEHERDCRPDARAGGKHRPDNRRRLHQRPRGRRRCATRLTMAYVLPERFRRW